MRLTKELRRTPCSIYFIQCGQGGPIKIGRTWGRVRKRLAALQRESPFTLRLLGVILKARPAAEGELHERFWSHRLRGEWFLPAAEILEYVAEVATPTVLAESPGDEDGDSPIAARRLMEQHQETVRVLYRAQVRWHAEAAVAAGEKD
jgi:hypothetical protein